MELIIKQRVVPHYNKNTKWGYIKMEGRTIQIGQFTTSIDIGDISSKPTNTIQMPQDTPQQNVQASINNIVQQQKAPNRRLNIKLPQSVSYGTATPLRELSSQALPNIAGKSLVISQNIVKTDDGNLVSVGLFGNKGDSHGSIVTTENEVTIYTDGDIKTDTIAEAEVVNYNTMHTKQEMEQYFKDGGKQDVRLSVFVDVADSEATEKEKELPLIDGRRMGYIHEFYRVDDSGVVAYYVPESVSSVETELTEWETDEEGNDILYHIDHEGNKTVVKKYDGGNISNGNIPLINADTGREMVVKSKYDTIVIEPNGNINVGGTLYEVGRDASGNAQNFTLTTSKTEADGKSYIVKDTYTGDNVTTTKELMKTYDDLTQTEKDAITSKELVNSGFSKELSDKLVPLLKDNLILSHVD